MRKRKYLAERNSPGHSDLVDKIESDEGEIDFSQELLTRHSGLFERIVPGAPTFIEEYIYGMSETKIDRTNGSLILPLQKITRGGLDSAIAVGTQCESYY